MSRKPWNSSIQKRRAVKQIIRNNPEKSQTEILFLYLKKTGQVSGREEFKKMKYEDRLVQLNSLRYHLKRMENEGEIKSRGGDMNSVVYEVKK